MPSQGSDRGSGVHFFKVILESNLLDGELRVPKSFVRSYWKEIPSAAVVLRLPNGTEWRVYWLKRDGDVWFCNGWKKFAEYLSLKESQFMVFRYEGESKFNVIVLGTSGLETKYPSSKEDDDEEGRKGYESDSSLEILDGKKRPRSPSSSSQTRKKMERCPKEEPESCYNVHAETKHGKKKECAGFDSAKHKNSGNSEVLDDGRMKKFHEVVKNSFHSDKDFFICSLRKTYTERDLLVIPNEFAKPVLQEKEGDATLFVGQKIRAWDVKMKNTTRRQFTITGGWKKFSVDNDLKIGDVCIFELINCKEVSFRVHIRRFGEESSTPRFEDHKGLSHHKPSSFLRSRETPKANSRFVSKNYFNVQMKHASALHYMVIPIDFIRNYTVHNGEYATLLVAERSWRVKILYYPANSFARFSQGWPQFVKDCNLKDRDSCRFEMIHEENLEFQVSISRAS